MRTSPSITRAGNPQPIGPLKPIWSTNCFKVSASASGVAGCGVGILILSVLSSPVRVSTTAP